MPKYIVGVDEAGRGPLAGPLSVAAVALPVTEEIEKYCSGVADSKQLSPAARDRIFDVLTREVSWAHVHIMPATLDKWGMSKALRVAVARVLYKLNLDPDTVEVKLDGTLNAPAEYHSQQTIVKGDVTEPIISAASIIAKVKRDRAMVRYAGMFPAYGFDQHKGYGTKKHRELIKKLGACRIHRRQFIRNIR